jgi:hypothetical protein
MTHPTHLSSIAALGFVVSAAAVLSGCPRNDVEGDGPTCEDTPTVIALDDDTALGFSANALVALAVTPSPFAAELVYARGGSTPLTLVVQDPGEARFVDSVAVYPDDGVTPAIGIECHDRLEVDANATFVSGDGAFNEAFAVVLRSEAVDAVTMNASLDPLALQGTYDVSLDVPEPDLAAFEEVSLPIDVAFDSDGSSGTVAVFGTGKETCDDDTCTAFAARIEVGSWGDVTR